MGRAESSITLFFATAAIAALKKFDVGPAMPAFFRLALTAVAVKSLSPNFPHGPLAKAQNIPLSDALDIIAAQEGFKTWSLLSARFNASKTSAEALSQVNPGDLLLIGARPGQGKTTIALQLVLKSALSGKNSWFLSLEWDLSDIHYRTRKTGINISQLGNRFQFDNSDDISAKCIISRIGSCLPGTVVTIDYLQLLDQDRSKPDLSLSLIHI